MRLPICLTFLFILSFNILGAQIFSKYYGGSGRDMFQDIKAAPNGNFYVLGAKSELGRKIWLLEVDIEGNVLWEKLYQNSVSGLEELGLGINILEDGNILITGEVLDRDNGWVMLVDDYGELIWKRSVEDITAFSAGLYLNGKYYLAGREGPQGTAHTGIFVIMDEDGNLDRRIEIEIDNKTFVKKVFTTVDGNILLVGRTAVNAVGFEGIFLQKRKLDGELIWTRKYETFANQTARVPMGAAIGPSGDIWVVNPAERSSKTYIYKFSPAGELIKKLKTGHYPVKEYPLGVAIRDDGDLVICGGFGEPGEEQRGLALLLNDKGYEKWRYTYGPGGENERFNACAVDNQGRVLMAGRSFSGDGNGDSDGWLARIGQNGPTYPFKISGNVQFDLEKDCEPDSNNLPAAHWTLTLENDEHNWNLITDRNGNFYASVPEGNYTIGLNTSDTPIEWEICQSEFQVVCDSTHPEADLQFLVQQKGSNCPHLELQLTNPHLSQCDSSTVHATVFNNGLEISDPLTLRIELDPMLHFVDSEVPAFLEGSTVEFDISSLPARSETNVSFDLELDCDAQLGTTHPIYGFLEPRICLPAWDGPVFEVTGECRGDEAVFLLRNTGGGGGQAVTTFSVLKNALKVSPEQAVFLPENGDTVELRFPAGGDTWRVELEQHPDIPYNVRSAHSITNCGESNTGQVKVGFANIFDRADDNPYCSFVFPANSLGLHNRILPHVSGLGNFNIINHLSPFTYTIRAKNPLEEEANRVEFLLFPSFNFDLSSVELLGGSGQYHISVSKDNAIKIASSGSEIPAGASAEATFRINSLDTLVPVEPIERLFIIKGRAHFNEGPGIGLDPGFNNYYTFYPNFKDEYNVYNENYLIYGGRGYDFSNKIHATNNNSLYFVGNSNSFRYRYNYSLLVTKTDLEGQVIWQNDYDFGREKTYIKAISALPNDDLILTGIVDKRATDGEYFVGYETFICRVSAEGKLLWWKLLHPVDSTFESSLWNMIETRDGYYLLFGSAANADGADEFAMKVDENGTIVWTFHQPVIGSNFIPEMAVELDDGSVVLAGSNKSTDLYFSQYVMKLDPTGNIVWKRGYDPKNNFGADVIFTPDGETFVLVGISRIEVSPGQYRWPPTFKRYTTDGDDIKTLYSDQFPYSGLGINALLNSPDGEIILAGDAYVDTVKGTDIVIAGFDQEGNPKWKKEFGNRNSESAYDIAMMPNNKLAIFGNNQSRPPNYDIQNILILTDSEGDVISDTRDPISTTDPGVLVYPNPVEDFLYVRLLSSPQGNIQWLLSDLTGKVLTRGEDDDGEFSIPVRNMPEGVYFLSFPNTGHTTQKVVVQRR